MNDTYVPDRTAQIEIEGVKIARLRQMTSAEMYREGWEEKGIVIELENGVLLFPSQDDEGNGPGILFGFHPGKGSFYPVVG